MPVAEQIDPTAFEYRTTHLVQHNNKQYPTGSVFKDDDPEVIAALRKAGAIVLPAELERPEAIAARQAELEAENAALRAELEALRKGGATAEAAAAAKARPSGAAAEAPAEPAKEAVIKASKAASQPASSASGGAGE